MSRFNPDRNREILQEAMDRGAAVVIPDFVNWVQYEREHDPDRSGFAIGLVNPFSNYPKETLVSVSLTDSGLIRVETIGILPVAGLAEDLFTAAERFLNQLADHVSDSGFWWGQSPHPERECRDMAMALALAAMTGPEIWFRAADAPRAREFYQRHREAINYGYPVSVRDESEIPQAEEEFFELNNPPLNPGP